MPGWCPTVYEADGSDRGKLNKWLPLYPAVLWIVNACEKSLIKIQSKSKQRKYDEKINPWTNDPVRVNGTISINSP